MQGGRGGRDNSLDPFAGFGGFGGHGSHMPSVFGGRDPFDDPFFRSPLGGTPFQSMFESSIFGGGGSPFLGTPSGFLGHQHPMPHAQPYPPQSNVQRGPIIEELDSDDEREVNEGATQWRDNPGMRSRSGLEPFIEYPDAAAEERMNGQIQFPNDYNRMNNSMQSLPQSQSFSFHSSSATYGGGNGSYYTKSSTRRTGSDGVTFEEQKEADSTTGQAFHEVSRGLYDKGHTLTRNLNSDGRVDNMQTLHNLNQDEVAGFEEAWKGKARQHLPGVSERLNGFNNTGEISIGQDGHTSRGGWALPSTEHPQPQPHPGAVSVGQDGHTTTGGWALPSENHPQPQPHPNAKRVRTNAGSPSEPTASQSQYTGRRIYENEFRGRA